MSKVEAAASATLKLPGGDCDITGKTLKNGVQQFLGVPYAEPVEGEKVFDAPQQIQMIKPDHHAGTREMDAPLASQPDLCFLCCSNYPGRCCLICRHACCNSTREDGPGPKGAGLDVLRMNIWAPGPKKSPVLVCFHGGGDAGSAKMADPNSRDGSILSAAQGLVVCSVDFRQGIFGTMDWGKQSGVPTNLELQDILCALKWIQSNIESFGGDPGCVTIYGESVGGRRVAELVHCKAASGLFHRAISVSPSAPEICNLSEAHRKHRRRLVLNYLKMKEEDINKAKLASIPRQKLINAQTAAKGGFAPLPRTKLAGASEQDKKDFGAGAQVPSTSQEWARASLGFLNWRMTEGLRTGFFDASVLDGELMSTPVGEGYAADVPLLLVFNKDEYSAPKMFPGLRPKDIKTPEQAAEVISCLLPIRGESKETSLQEIALNYFNEYAKLFPTCSTGEVAVHVLQDTWQYHSVIALAKNHAAAHQGGKTFIGHFVYDCGGGQCPHGADVSFCYGKMPNMPIHGKGKDFDGMTTIMQSVWGAFARDGNPALPMTQIPFEAFRPEDPKMTLLDSGKTGGGCRISATFVERDPIYQRMVEALRKAETQT